MKRIVCTIALVASIVCAQAQQVNTLFFLENAPSRHLINPALIPVSDGYIQITPLGYIGTAAGNNRLTLSDVIYADPTGTGKTITALHPNGDRDALMRTLKALTTVNGDLQLNMLSFGRRTRSEKGFWHVGIMMRGEFYGRIPTGMMQLISNGASPSLTETTMYDLSHLGLGGTLYTEFGGGYTHRINDQWTVGGKLKFLVGTAHAAIANSNIIASTAANAVALKGMADVYAAAPVRMDALDNKAIADINPDDLIRDMAIKDFFRPSGYGMAVDLGFTYKPIEQVQISAALTDLGFITWTNGRHYQATMDTAYVGIGELDYADRADIGKRIGEAFQGLGEAFYFGQHEKKTFSRMITTKLNVGVDANFLDNLLGIGVLSATRYYGGKFYEEVTIGGAIRPCNWFNFALSYSLVNNGKYSNIGAGISLMPYDGINLTMAMDYIPTSYVAYTPESSTQQYAIPYKTRGVNLALGLSIVWGTNKQKDKDKDGVIDKWDMCPNTPLNVHVDALGCPLDSDGDGVPDYLDECPGTPAAAYGFINEVGCPTDEDGDGVYDYMDECPGTPEGARGHVDDKGCELDSDGDGVPDWRDDCPNTPEEERPYIDERGCTIMTDDDGDGVPNWKDRCPNTPAAARGFVDTYGCELDSDGDGVMDWEDECPTVAGPRVNKGCPVMSREVKKLLEKAMQGIEFETGKAIIKKKSFSLLNEIAQTFKENPSYIIEVQGHTDNTGSDKLNTELSDKRANAVRNYLIGQGVEAERMTAVGYGPSMPIADNSTKAGRQKNRRVEFKITFEEVHTEQVYDHLDETLVEEVKTAEKAVEEQKPAE